MPKLKPSVRKFNPLHLRVIGIAAILLSAVFLLWHSNANSNQAIGALMAQVEFRGEYRIADGPWQPIEEGAHIPSTKGDVTLRRKSPAVSAALCCGMAKGSAAALIAQTRYNGHLLMAICLKDIYQEPITQEEGFAV